LCIKHNLTEQDGGIFERYLGKGLPIEITTFLVDKVKIFIFEYQVTGNETILRKWFFENCIISIAHFTPIINITSTSTIIRKRILKQVWTLWTLTDNVIGTGSTWLLTLCPQGYTGWINNIAIKSVVTIVL